MKKGKWNYTEDISYRVILVKLLPVPEPKMHWQNAFVGETRQVVEITGRVDYTFYIDNEDGSGLLKIERGGGPDSYSAHLNKGEFEIIREVPESDWFKWNEEKHNSLRAICDKWQQETYPEEFEKMQSLKRMISNMRSGNWYVDAKGTIKEGKK